MSDPTTPTIIGTTTGLLSIGAAGIFGVTWGAFAMATGLSILGAFSYQFLKTQLAREQAQAEGKARNDFPTIDWRTTFYAMVGAPLSTGTLLWMIQVFGGLHNMYSIGGFYFAGALGPQLVPVIFSLVQRTIAGVGALK